MFSTRRLVVGAGRPDRDGCDPSCPYPGIMQLLACILAFLLVSLRPFPPAAALSWPCLLSAWSGLWRAPPLFCLSFSSLFLLSGFAPGFGRLAVCLKVEVGTHFGSRRIAILSEHKQRLDLPTGVVEKLHSTAARLRQSKATTLA